MIDVPASIEDVLALPSVDYLSRGQLPDEPGLYFAVLDGERVGYVGMSATSLRGRWQQHHRAIVLLCAGKLAVHYLAPAPGLDLSRAEVAAISIFDPSFNRLNRPQRRVFPTLPAGDPETVLLSVAAAETGYSAERIRKMVIAGQLEGFKEHERYWVITRAALDELKSRPKQHRGWPKGKRRPPRTP